MTNTDRIARNLAGVERSLIGYKQMLAVAEQHGMEYEIDRLTSTIDEFEGEADYLRDELLNVAPEFATELATA